MGLKFFNKKLQKSCAWCSYGIKSEFSSDIFCKKRGIVKENEICRKYTYDPLKRTPDSKKIDKNYKKEDFAL